MRIYSLFYLTQHRTPAGEMYASLENNTTEFYFDKLEFRAQRAADGAPPARRTVDGMLAVHGAGEDTGNARFTRAARSRKEIRVPDGIRRDLVFENAHDVFLTHHIVELRRSEFSIKG